MATRTKTVEFVFPTVTTSLTAATRRDLTAITVYIPESSPVFRSVEVELTCSDAVAGTAGSPTSWLIGIKLGAVAFSDVTVTSTYTNSGEAQAFRWTRNVTSYFTTNWTGTSMSCQVGINIGGVATNNHCAKLRITYEYDDTSATHIKTVWIPIESTRSTLTTSFQTVGGATAIPALTGSYLPEASRTIRQIWVELWGNEAANSTGVFTFQMRVNAGTTVSWWDSLSTLNSARWAYGIVDITALDLSAARSLECLSLTTTARGEQIGGMVGVTYEFSPSSSSTIHNSVLIHGLEEGGYVQGTTTGDLNIDRSVFWIEEPTTITLKESAILFYCATAGGGTVGLGAGAQTPTTYAFTAGALQCGGSSAVHRIDGGGTNATPFATIARGKNNIDVKWYATANMTLGAASALVVFNYTSGKATGGVGTHNQTRYFALADHAANATQREISATAAATIAETSYFVNDATLYCPYLNTGLATYSMTVSAEVVSGEGTADGWLGVIIAAHTSDAENGNYILYGDLSPWFYRWAGGGSLSVPFDRHHLNPETARKWRIQNIDSVYAGLGVYMTWHSVTFSVAGTVTGYTGDGSGITVEVFRAATHSEKVGSTTTSTGGTYSFTWYDNTENVFASARQDATHLGRSNIGTAT